MPLRVEEEITMAAACNAARDWRFDADQVDAATAAVNSAKELLAQRELDLNNAMTRLNSSEAKVKKAFGKLLQESR